jgi:ABC-type branched-subunit amino acid transport system ATPase component
MEVIELVRSARFTVLLGKNGSGKSTLLRAIDARRDVPSKYISPERGGVLKYEPNVDQNIASSQNWLTDNRRRNRAESFRQQSASQFRSLELFYLREIEKNPDKRTDLDYTFDTVIAELNEFLPAIRLRRGERGFSIVNRDGQLIDEAEISSGESEFIALAIEVLVYAKSEQQPKLLLLDEPDVHLHPDLQAKFVGFVEKAAVAADMRVVIATHSTALISGFSAGADLQVAPVLSRGQAQFESYRRTEISDELVPIFGAHPLSSVFNRSPIILVEGDDDRRVIEQLVRSSGGRVRLTPCVVGTVSAMNEWEQWLSRFLPALYDDPLAMSLRDLDGNDASDIEDLGCVRRLRLSCYAMENLLLTDEVLDFCGLSAEAVKDLLVAWTEKFPSHSYVGDANGLIEDFTNRRVTKIKNLRNVLVALLGTNKPWEVLLGQVLASTDWLQSDAPDSLRTYLGGKTVATIFSR